MSFGGQNGLLEGSMNPCGGGTCTATGFDTYTCSCTAPFVAGTSIDGTQTCVPSE